MNRCWRGPCLHLVVLCVASLIFGCQSTPEVVPSSGPRPPTSAGMVKIYEKAPKKYERLGNVTVSRAEGARTDNRGNAEVAFDTALGKAAALGANGLLLEATPGETTARATAGYRGTFYQVPFRGNPPTAVFQAIYVLKE